MQRIDRIGKVYGMLTVIDQYWENDIGYCTFRCECGNIITKRAYNFIYAVNQNCGCVKKVNPEKSKFKNPEYNIWKSMKQRCINPNNIGYKNYGGRGISVSEEWSQSFDTFYKDMGPRPEKTTLERINNEGSYCKENCRWATWDDQAHNKRNSRPVEYVDIDDTLYSLKELSNTFGISITTIKSRYYKQGLRGVDLIKPGYKKRRKRKK